MKTLTIGILTLVLLSACASQDKVKKGQLADIPDWVLAPESSKGINESACVTWTGNLAVDKDHATHIARDRLAQQLQIRAAGMSKAFANKTVVAEGQSISTDFESVSRQIFDQTLQGSKLSQAGLFIIDNRKQFCVLVGIDQKKTQDVYQSLITASGTKLSAKDDAILFEQFKAWKAQQALQEALGEKKQDN